MQNRVIIVRGMLYIGLTILILLIIVLSTYIAFSQGINFDEALFLQVPSSLVTQGSYSTTYDGGMPFDPWVTTGPTVLLPIYLVFNYFGIGIYQARIIMLIYFLLMLSISFLTSRHLFGIASAIGTSTLILLMPQMFFFGLKVVGEVPAAFYMLLAVMLLAKEKPLFSGFFMGLAVLTKFVFSLFVLPLFLLFGLEYFLSTTIHKKKIFVFYSLIAVGALVPNLVWEIVKLLSLGSYGYIENTETFNGIFNLVVGLGQSASPSILTRIEILSYPFDHIPSIIVLALLAIVFLHNLLAVSKHLKRAVEWTNKDRSKLFLILFSITSLIWWLSGLNIGWWRHIFPSYIVIMLLIGNSFASLVKFTANSIQILNNRENWRSAILHLTVTAITIYLFIFIIIVPTKAQVERITPLSSETLASQIQLGSEISNITQKGGVISYWGWWQSTEISFLTQTQFLNIGNSYTRKKLNKLTKQGQKILVLVSPVQRELAPEAWSEENIFCGQLAIKKSGYELYEYVPSYDWENQYKYLVERGAINTLSSTYDLNEPTTLRSYYEGFYTDGWIAKNAIMWLRNYQKFDVLTIEGSVNLDVYDQKPVTVRVYVMDSPVAEPVLSQSGEFVWEIDIPSQAKSYNALRITIEPSFSFVPKVLGINNDGRELSIVIRSINLH